MADHPQPTTDKRLRASTIRFLRRAIFGTLLGAPAESIRAEIERFGLYVNVDRPYPGGWLYYIEASPQHRIPSDNDGFDTSAEHAAERIGRKYMDACAEARR